MKRVVETIGFATVFTLALNAMPSREALAQSASDELAACSVPAGTELFEFEIHGARLRGYIDRPPHGEKVPAVLMINGSLPTNVMAGGSIGGLKQVLLDQGIAFVTWDNPGSGCSEGETRVIPDLFARADEVAGALDELRNRADIDFTRVGALALSQGTWVASIVAARSDELAFLVLLSAPGRDMTEQAAYLVQTNLELDGYSKDESTKLASQYRAAQIMAIAGAHYDDYRFVSAR